MHVDMMIMYGYVYGEHQKIIFDSFGGTFRIFSFPNLVSRDV